MNIWICDLQGNLIEEINKQYTYQDGVRGITLEVKENPIYTYHGSILDKNVDAIVSPANSFGFMDGGIDALYTKFFGPQVQDRLQKRIQERPLKELLVGEALVISTEHSFIECLICAPTMRVPQVIHDIMDVFLATRAAVKVAKEHHFRSISLPGMGTGCGRVSPALAATAMLNGIREALNPSPFPQSIRHAHSDHIALRR